MNKEILRLAIPNILSNISVPLLSTVDTALMGQLSPIYLGAVGMGAMVFNFIYWNFGFLRMGTTGMVAQAHGAEDVAETFKLLYFGLILSIVIALAIMLVSPWIFETFFALLQVSEDHKGPLLTYCNIRIWAAPATLSIYVMMGWLLGRQNSIVPMVITILINIINIIISYVLVYHYQFNIKGVAWGTTISQYVGLLSLTLYFAVRYGSEILLSLKKVVRHKRHIVSFFRINRDLFIRTVGLTISFVYVYRVSSQGGEIYLAINVIILQLLNWVSFGIDGFAFACESVVGKYVGRNNNYLINRAMRLSFLWAFALALLYSVLFAYLLGPIIELFTSDLSTFTGVMDMYWVIVVLPIVSFPCYIWDGIYIGFLQSRYMRDTMIISLIFFVSVHLCLKSMGYDLLWYSFLFFLLIRALLQYYYWIKRVQFIDVIKSL